MSGLDRSQFYLTDPTTRRTSVVTLATLPNGTVDQSKVISKQSFLPHSHEYLTNGQIKNKQVAYTRRFLQQCFMNPSLLTHPSDKQTVLTKLLDFNLTVVGCLGLALLMRRSLNKIYLPFVQMHLEDYRISLKTINTGLAGLFCIVGCRSCYVSLIDQPYLYDIGLQYQEQVCPTGL